MERLAKLEAHLETLLRWMDKVDQRLDHQDSCIDSLKRQVWMATGAIGLLTVLGQFLPLLQRFFH